ncbi:hypothetical protein D3C74_155710 [compost metagenome]
MKPTFSFSTLNDIILQAGWFADKFDDCGYALFSMPFALIFLSNLKSSNPIVVLASWCITDVKGTNHLLIKGWLKGLLLVGTTDFHVPMLVEKTHELHCMFPMVKYRILRTDAYRLATLLKSGDIDIVIVNLPMEINIGDFNNGKVKPNWLFTVCSRVIGGWNEGREEVPFSELKSIPLVETRREEGKGGKEEQTY